MRNTLVILFFELSLLSSGSTFYVATNGKDSNIGSIEFPFNTLKKAWSQLMAGDTVFMRGGTYNNSIMPPTSLLADKSGTRENPIIIQNYRGEKPILDYSDAIYTTQKIGIKINNVDYLYLKGIRITNINQPIIGTIAQYGLILWNDVNNCIFELIETDHIGGWGVTIGDNSKNNIFLNCDSHHNADPYSAIPYGWSDGFQSSSPSSTNNIFRGCRSWSNSDDGWDLRIYDGSAIIESCWAFRNGYLSGTWINAGNGEGFKLGIKRLPNVTTNLRTIKNCLAFDNYAVGFHSSFVSGYGTFQCIIYNSVAFRNGVQRSGEGFCFEQVGVVNTFKNNISYKNPHDYINPANNHTNNTWNGGVKVTDEDFISLDTTGVSGARMDNGDLPYLDLLKLAPTSDLIDAGVNVGLQFHGKSPDIGAFETSFGEVYSNSPPVINISIPIKGDSFKTPVTITIDIDVFDPDGDIILVELFNGANKLGEITSAPYTFTLKDLPVGTYSLTAIATDNQNSTSISSKLKFQVISNSENLEYFHLYPNPNNGCFSIDLSLLYIDQNYTLSVVNMAGKTVYRKELPKETDHLLYDLSYLNPGTYIIMIKSNLIALTQKFIKA